MVGQDHLPPVEQVFCAGHGLSLCTPKTSMSHHAIRLDGWLKHVRFFFCLRVTTKHLGLQHSLQAKAGMWRPGAYPIMYQSDATLFGDSTTNTGYITKTVTDTSAVCHDRVWQQCCVVKSQCNSIQTAKNLLCMPCLRRPAGPIAAGQTQGETLKRAPGWRSSSLQSQPAHPGGPCLSCVCTSQRVTGFGMPLSPSVSAHPQRYHF